ncbi:MAG: glycosyltransferase family 1 protein [Verrucomicrobia bacterium]|nr:glycosyltransferase family 1 protein [Verrucomicrobiota bacterium]
MGEATRAHRIVLASVGTDGDLYPFLGLGRVLARRGFAVTLASHEHFGPLAVRDGLDFAPLVTRSETEDLLRNPQLWHPLWAPFVVARWGRTLIRRQYAELHRVATAGDRTWLVANPGVVAARVLEDFTGIPTLSVVLQPWLFPSVEAPPAMLGGLTLPSSAPRWLGRMYYRGYDGIGWFLVGRSVNQLRRELKLPPVRQVLKWWFARRGILALFPGWFGAPQKDWPEGVRLCGFPGEDGLLERPLTTSVDQFLDRGQPTVAFTFGTGMRHAAGLFRECVAACQQLGVPGILLTPHRGQLPTQLPPQVLHCEFAPFQRLFPRCAAVVHHGGIGTTAKALAAGTPQLILPFAFDQLDNACRVKRLGAGQWLPTSQRRATDLAESIRRLLSPESRARAAAIAAAGRGRPGLEVAADEIERVMMLGWVEGR